MGAAYRGGTPPGIGCRLAEGDGSTLERPEPGRYALSMDTLAATRALETKGFSRDQAEALVGLLHSTISSELVTKAEAAASEARLTEQIVQSQAAIEHRLEVLTERIGTVEAQFSKLLVQELRKVDDRISKEVHALDAQITSEVRGLDARITSEARGLDERITSEARGLDGRITQEVRRLDERIAKLERDIAVQGLYVRTGVAMIAALFIKAYWDPLVRALGFLS